MIANPIIDVNGDSVSLTVVVPCYNSAETIARCANSIDLSANSQVIYIDDGSSDETYQVLCGIKAHEKRYEVILLQNEHNLGPGETRNLGVRYASKDYVMFLDSDDFLAQGALGEIYQALELNAPDVLVFDAFMQKGSHFHLLKMFAAHDLQAGEVRSRDAFVYGKGCVWGKVYKKSLIEDNEIRFLDIPRGEDVPFAKVAFALANSIWYLEKPLYNYLENPASIMHDARTIVADDPMKVFAYIKQRLTGSELEEELDTLYYTLGVYPTIVNLLRQREPNSMCAEVWDQLTSQMNVKNAYFNRLERKFRLAYELFKRHIFFPLRLALKNG